MVLALGADAYTLRLDSADPYLCDAVITIALSGRSQSLYDPAGSPFACDEPHFTIHWSGDLDRDGHLDLVVAFSSKYSYHPRQILLSSAAAPGELVGQAGGYERFAQ